MPRKKHTASKTQSTRARNSSASPHNSTTAVASESLQEMVHEMELQLNHVMSSPVFTEEVKMSNTEDDETADAFKETPPMLDEDVVKTLDVPKWLSDERTAEHLQKAIKEQNLEKEYECTIELFGLGTSSNTSDSNNGHLLITMKGTDTRQLGRARRALEDILIKHLVEVTPETNYRDNNNKYPYPPSLGRLLYSLALSAADNSPKWNDRNRHRTVMGRAKLPLLSKAKVWMNIVELPKDDEGKFHGLFLAGKGGKLFEYYRERFGCRVDIYGDFMKNGDVEKNDNESALLCDPYVLVTSKDGKSNVDDCLQFIEHRIREHADKFGVSRDREVELEGEKRRFRRHPKAEGQKAEQKQHSRQRRGRSSGNKKKGETS